MTGSDRTHQAVNMPTHYIGRDGLEARRVIEDCGIAPGFYIGNAIKYLLRAGKKSAQPVTDLMKARRNLEMLEEVSEDGVPLSGCARRLVPTGRIAAAFDLSERVTVAVALLTVPAITRADIAAVRQLVTEEIDGHLPVANRGSAA